MEVDFIVEEVKMFFRYVKILVILFIINKCKFKF